MKKSYLVKNILSGINAFLCTGWDYDHVSHIDCKEYFNGSDLSSIDGDIYYFRFSDFFESEIEVYNDFIIRFGSRYGGDIINDIDVFKVVRDSTGHVVSYHHEFFISVEKKTLCDILGELLRELLLSFSFIKK